MAAHIHETIAKSLFKNCEIMTRYSVLGSCKCQKVFQSLFFLFKSSHFVTEKSGKLVSIITAVTHACLIGMVINILMDRVTFLAIFVK